MTAAMLVLEPIFEADLPSELYAYRPGRNAQQAVVEVEELLFRRPSGRCGRRPRGLLGCRFILSLLQNSISATHFAFIRRCERPRLRPARAGTA